MEENIFVEVKKKPTFLKTLCILTFIGAPFLILKYINSYIGIIHTITEFNSIKTSHYQGGYEGGFGAQGLSINNIIEGSSDYLLQNGAIYYILLMIASVICVIGAILMLKLKKIGYFIYLIGEIAPIILLFILIKGFQGFGLIDYITVSTSFLFVILYSLNFKHLS